jgi:hypothetical protein
LNERYTSSAEKPKIQTIGFWKEQTFDNIRGSHAWLVLTKDLLDLYGLGIDYTWRNRFADVPIGKY